MSGQQMGFQPPLSRYVLPAVVIYHQQLRVIDSEVGESAGYVLTHLWIGRYVLDTPVLVVQAQNDNGRVRRDDGQGALQLGPMVLPALLARGMGTWHLNPQEHAHLVGQVINAWIDARNMDSRQIAAEGFNRV